MKRLYKELVKYSDSDMYPYHMPGHKRRYENGFLSDVLKYDITEIDNFDDLHEAEGLILEAEKRAAEYYGSEETHYLVNGSSCGVISAICGSTHKGDEVILGRNCHKSAYFGLMIGQLRAKYIYPDVIASNGVTKSIQPSEIEKMLIDNPDAKAVIITSPTYEGIVSDIASIAQIVHEYGKILIVDEAHGAHFGISEDYPKSAVTLGADIVIQSLHKMLPSPTQTALIHINGELVDRKRLREKLVMFQSSSPSYLLMGAMEDCIDYISSKGRSLADEYIRRINDFAKEAAKLKALKYLSREELIDIHKAYDIDPCKIVISTEKTTINGRVLYDILRNEYHLQPEMAAGNYVIMIMSVMDKEEAFDRLINALNIIDSQLVKTGSITNKAIDYQIAYPVNDTKLSPAEADDMDKEYCLIAEAYNHISADIIAVYPPGIPIVVPGEVISRECIENIEKAIANGLRVTGLNNGKVSVIWEKSTIS